MKTQKERHEKYHKTKKGVTKMIYGAQKQHAKTEGGNPPSYTMLELREWCYSQVLFHKLFREWVRSDYDRMLKPSVGRIDGFGEYTFDNIKIMTWINNMEKPKARIQGVSHGNARPKKYWETNPTRRGTFKETCNKLGWDFNKFEETFSGEYSGVIKKYYYKAIK